jgi:hypothetical protein
MEYFLHVVKNPQNCLVLEKSKAHKVFAHKLIFVVYLLYLGKETRTHTHTHSGKLRILAMQLKLSTCFEFQLCVK